MRFFALTTATADLPEVPDIQESLTAIQKFIKTASPVVLNALWHIALALVIFCGALAHREIPEPGGAAG